MGSSAHFDGELPEGWAESALNLLLSTLESGSRPKGGVRGIKDGIPSIGGEHVNDRGGFNFSNVKYVPKSFANEMNRGKIQQRDVLIVKDGATTGKVSFVDKSFPYKEAFVNEHVFINRVNSELNSKCIFYYLYSKEGQERILENFKGSAQGGINQTFAPNTLVPLPPLPEQNRIVEKLDKILPLVEACKSNLKNFPITLKRFRRSVLIAATTGLLTNNLDLKGWTDCELNDVADSLDNKRVPINKEERLKRKGNIPYYGANGRVGLIDDYIFDEPLILVVEDETFIGREIPFCYIIRGKSWVNNHAHVLRPKKNTLLDYLNYSLMFYPFTPLTSGTTGRRKLTKGALLSAPYILPPIEEQAEIVRRVEALFGLADQLEAQYLKAKAKVDKLTQSVLAKAFRGELVPQDPNDEPASDLLERIKPLKDSSPDSTKKSQRKLKKVKV